MAKTTPSEVLYNELRHRAHINNRDAARLLLSSEAAGSKPAPRLKVVDKTFLSRRVVHVTPGKDKIDPAMFRDFSLSVPDLSAAIAAKTEGALAQDTPEARESCRAAAEHMARALDEWQLDGSVLRNAIDRIALAPGLAFGDRLVLGLMAFTVSGCLADPVAAVEAARSYAAEKLAFTFSTMETTEGTAAARGEGTAAEDVQLGLVRVDADGTALSQIYPLSTKPGGTVIGSFAQGQSTITDVGVDVSHEHLRIERADGEWVACGLGSTNGTVLQHEDGTVEVVEEPAKMRAGGSSTSPRTVHAGDKLRIGSSTVFLVMRTRHR